MACASIVSPIEIFAADEIGRHRHWSDEEKIRIVEESLRGFRQGSATARRYGISRSLLSIWRREYRSGTLGASGAGGGFVPLVIAGAPPTPAEQPSREADDVMRGVVHDPEMRPVSDAVEDEFGYAEMQVVSFEDRNHPVGTACQISA